MDGHQTAGPGALNVDMVCQEGHFIVDNISFYRDTKLGTELTAEADWKRRGLYIGPQVRCPHVPASKAQTQLSPLV